MVTKDLHRGVFELKGVWITAARCGDSCADVEQQRIANFGDVIRRHNATYTSQQCVLCGPFDGPAGGGCAPPKWTITIYWAHSTTIELGVECEHAANDWTTALK